MPSVLIVDDERDLAALLLFNLQQVGFEAVTAHSGEEALTKLREHTPDLVILDLMLPDMSGADLCRSLKANSKTRGIPIIMLTAKGEEAERVRGFEAGADDYVTKPFSVRELQLRVKAVLRRSNPEGAPVSPHSVGALRLEPQTHRCFVEDREVPLTLLEFRLLEHLMARVGRVQSREQLLRDVWEVTADIETRTVDTHVMRLREKLGPARDYLETVRGVGYRMVKSPSGS